MKTAVFLLLPIVLLVLVFQQESSAEPTHQSKDEIVWYRADFPPVTIPCGPDEDTGFFDKAMNHLTDNLLNYEHKFKVANFGRIIAELGRNSKSCCPSLYKNEEREKFIKFSAPAMVVLPNGLISLKKNRKKLAPYIDEKGTISLQKLLQDKQILLGISRGRKYSGGIDQILKQFEGQENILVRSGADVFKGLMLMMNLKRVDCILGYPIEAGYMSKLYPEFEGYDYIPIKESTVPFTVGYVGCPNNEWGRNVIRQVDELILELRDNEFIEYYGSWLDESTRVMHRKIAQDYYKSLEADE